ncbi:MAG: phenylacetate--CoA ligase family protein [bacterium]|nr:phenylacetate--CoA ligase family protein [bacterium]
MFDILQFTAKHFFFRIREFQEKGTTLAHLKEMERIQFQSRSEIEALQLTRVRALLTHAHQNCPFYAKRLDEAGIKPSGVQTFDDLLRLPVLTKKDIQQSLDSLRARNYPVESLVPNKTGGSTGSPLHFYHDQDRLFSRKAATIRHNRWAGWDIGMKTASFWGHRQDISGMASFGFKLRSMVIDRLAILDTSSITRERLAEFKTRLQSYRPGIYIAYANSMFLFARFLKETNSTDHHRPKAIITSAEVLEPDQRSLIESVFECKVYDRYGSRETSVLASECDHHSGLHIGADGFLVEFIRDGKPAKPGETGKIVVTDLLNFGMPFIRYQIEDTGMPVAGNCGCGRGLPLMKMAGGRTTDFLVTPSGKIVSGASLTIYLIANTPGVAQAQLIQEKKDEVVFRIVKGEKFGDASLTFLAAEIPKYLGSDVKYQIEYVDTIPVESSGKYRFSISKVDPASAF